MVRNSDGGGPKPASEAKRDLSAERKLGGRVGEKLGRLQSECDDRPEFVQERVELFVQDEIDAINGVPPSRLTEIERLEVETKILQYHSWALMYERELAQRSGRRQSPAN